MGVGVLDGIRELDADRISLFRWLSFINTLRLSREPESRNAS